MSENIESKILIPEILIYVNGAYSSGSQIQRGTFIAGHVNQLIIDILAKSN